MKEMNIFERTVGSRRYRIASQSVWDPVRQRPFARQAVLGPADPPPVADLGATTIGVRNRPFYILNLFMSGRCLFAVGAALLLLYA